MYFNLHVDRQFGRIYPLAELNCSWVTNNVDLNKTPHHGVLNLGTFQSSDELLEIAVGANVVIIPNKLEFGAVYQRPISSSDHFDFNGVLVKLVYRY
jgi:hypothetical protein